MTKLNIKVLTSMCAAGGIAMMFSSCASFDEDSRFHAIKSGTSTTNAGLFDGLKNFEDRAAKVQKGMTKAEAIAAMGVFVVGRLCAEEGRLC